MAKQSYSGRFIFLVKRLVSRGWGYPFIASFLILLVLSAISLALGAASVAEVMADIAYFSLVAGVILELAYLSKKASREGVLQ